MSSTVLLFIFCVVFNDVTTQTLDDIMPSSVPVTIQNPAATTTTTDSKWNELLPALKTIKSTSKIKKERLLNLIKIIKYLLSEEIDSNPGETAQMLEEIKETEDVTFPDFESIVEERLKPIQEALNDQKYMLDGEIKNETIAQNKTADFSKILAKISAALAKAKEQNQSAETKTSSMLPILRSRNCLNDFDLPLFGNSRPSRNTISSQSQTNPMSSSAMFNIPCQRAADILEETANFPLPREVFCDNPTVNLKSLAKNTKLNLENLPFDNIVPNSISCVDSDDSIAVLFKPKTISLMQAYGKLLKKITLTVLVPYYVSKLAI